MSSGATPEQIEAAAQEIGWMVVRGNQTYRDMAESCAAIFVPPTQRIVNVDDLMIVKFLVSMLDGYKAPEQIEEAVWSAAASLKRLADATK